MRPDIIVPCGFRTHILLPHDVVGSIIDDKPTWRGMTVNSDGVYFRGGEPVLIVQRKGTTTTAKAFRDIYLQEPALSVKLERIPDATWRGYGKRNQWTSPAYPLALTDAHRATVHFPRVQTNPKYTVGVEYRSPGVKWRFRSDGGFTRLLDAPAGPVPWEGCEVFGEGYDVAGVCPNTSERSLRRWELAGHPTFHWMHFSGWSGGSGAVTNAQGRTPPPGMDVSAADGYDKLWDEKSWRRLGRGQSISQTLTMKRL